ncbi:MAG: hypothetical protein HUJ27_17100 [Rhodobacteraceae bacterium]|nr:hypothetical protein [Paracoccaceae bacterium]
MFEGISRFVAKRALLKGLKRRAPGSFVYRPENNYYVSEIIESGTERRIIVEDVCDGKIIGRLWNGDKFDDTTEASLDGIRISDVRITRFYGYLRYDYKDALDFWKYELTGIPIFQSAKERLSQSIYNVRFRFRDDRIRVLRKIVSLHLERARANNGLLHDPDELSVVSLASELYGNRIYTHPKREEFFALLRLTLDSLVSSGDLDGDKRGYKINGKALVTLSEYEQEERRHSDSVKQDRKLFWITAAIAAATAMQAYSAFLFG